MLNRVAEEAEARPYLVNDGRGDPDDVMPHTLRHGAAWRMMSAEKGEYAVGRPKPAAAPEYSDDQADLRPPD